MKHCRAEARSDPRGAARDLGVAGLLRWPPPAKAPCKTRSSPAILHISQFQFRDQSISSAEAQLKVARQHANFTLHSVIAQGKVEAKGDVALSGEYTTSRFVDVRALPVGTLLASYLSASAPESARANRNSRRISGPTERPGEHPGAHANTDL